MEKQRNDKELVGALAVLFCGGALWSGLYAPAQQLIVTGVMALAVLRTGGTALLSRAEWGALALLVAGVVGSLFHPASAGTAAYGPVVMVGWMLALVLGRQLQRSGQAERALWWAWIICAPLIVFGGLVAMSYLPEHHSGRIASFIGYPIAVGLLGMLGGTCSLTALYRGERWASVLLFGNGVAFFLSGSRGVWFAGLLLACYLAWAMPHLLRPPALPLAVALVVTLWAGPGIASANPVPGLMGLLLGSLTLFLAEWFRYETRWRWSRLGALAVLLIALAAFAPGWRWLARRAAALSLTEGSVLERITMFKDGLALLAQWPLGAGYRAWAGLHLQGASYGYYSAEVHSAPLDLALAFGWAGAAGFMWLLGRFLFGLRKGREWQPERLVVLGGLGALGIHSLVDWELSYGIFAAALWLGFGMMGPDPPEAGVPFSRLRARRSLLCGLPLSVRASIAGLVLAAVIWMGAGALFTMQAERTLDAGRPELAYRHAQMALALTPWQELAHAHAGRALSVLGDPQGALDALASARRLGPREPWYAELQGQELRKAGRWLDAAAAYRDLVRLWPWEVVAYEAALDAHVEMLIHAKLTGDSELGEALKQSAREILSALQEQKVKEPALAPRSPLEVNSPAIQRARAHLE